MRVALERLRHRAAREVPHLERAVLGRRHGVLSHHPHHPQPVDGPAVLAEPRERRAPLGPRCFVLSPLTQQHRPVEANERRRVGRRSRSGRRRLLRRRRRADRAHGSEALPLELLAQLRPPRGAQPVPDALAAAIGGGATEGAAAPQRGQQGRQAVALGHLAQHLHDQILREGREQEAAAAVPAASAAAGGGGGGGGGAWSVRSASWASSLCSASWFSGSVSIASARSSADFASARRPSCWLAAARRWRPFRKAASSCTQRSASASAGCVEAEAEVARRPVAQQRHEQLVPGLGRHRVCRDERFRVQADGERERAPLERRVRLRLQHTDTRLLRLEPHSVEARRQLGELEAVGVVDVRRVEDSLHLAHARLRGHGGRARSVAQENPARGVGVNVITGPFLGRPPPLSPRTLARSEPRC